MKYLSPIESKGKTFKSSNNETDIPLQE